MPRSRTHSHFSSHPTRSPASGLQSTASMSSPTPSSFAASAHPAPPASPNVQNLPEGIFNTGYYRRFFVEEKKLGSGSFGSVFLCHHLLDDIHLGTFAVKKVPVGDNRPWLEKVLREVKALERLRHPNIIDYKHSWVELHSQSEFCPPVPFLFILMTYCNKGSLEDLLWPNKQDQVYAGSGEMPESHFEPVSSVILEESHIWRILIDITLGLQHLHHAGIIHRDLKPSNILLDLSFDEVSGTEVTRCLFSDFGQSELRKDVAGHMRERRGCTGTVEFTAPELLDVQADGTYRYDYDEKSDMWSLGVVLYALCFSSLPYTSANFQDCVRKIVHGQTPIMLPSTPRRSPELLDIVTALMSRNPRMRPSTDDILRHPRILSVLEHGYSTGRAPFPEPQTFSPTVTNSWVGAESNLAIRSSPPTRPRTMQRPMSPSHALPPFEALPSTVSAVSKPSTSFSLTPSALSSGSAPPRPSSGQPIKSMTGRQLLETVGSRFMFHVPKHRASRFFCFVVISFLKHVWLTFVCNSPRLATYALCVSFAIFCMEPLLCRCKDSSPSTRRLTGQLCLCPSAHIAAKLILFSNVFELISSISFLYLNYETPSSTFYSMMFFCLLTVVVLFIPAKWFDALLIRADVFYQQHRPPTGSNVIDRRLSLSLQPSRVHSD
eukprot:GILJ01009931.1.p1 GENE.GILJ01009931.1~~GILJ01009931.1.p1  ORF type:complete len:766 (+),score=100.95 GILJ01009931.1:313-2298(+)